MKNFKIADGDLALSSARRVDFVVGSDKLIQDLTLWLMEPLGIGFTTPNFGSLLHDMIGEADPELQSVEVESEVIRILHLYQSTQLERVKQARDNGQLYLFSKREVLNAIRDVAAKPMSDRVVVNATIRTGLNDNDAAINIDVGPQAARVNANNNGTS